MKHQQQFLKERGFSQWKIITAIAIVLIFIIWIVVQSMPSKMIRKKQIALLQGIEKRNGPRTSRLVAENYLDRWKFNRDDIVKTTVDVGGQFLVVVVKGEEVSYSRDGKTATVKMNLKLGGKPLGVFGNEITRRVNALKKPFVFTWKKQSFLPSSWRLVKLDNPELPDGLYGYTPGALREMVTAP